MFRAMRRAWWFGAVLGMSGCGHAVRPAAPAAVRSATSAAVRVVAAPLPGPPPASAPTGADLAAPPGQPPSSPAQSASAQPSERDGEATMRRLLAAAGGLQALALYFGDDSDGGDAGQLGARWVIVSGVADDGRGG